MFQAINPFSHLSGVQSGVMISSSYKPPLEQRVEAIQKRGKHSTCDHLSKKALAMRCLDLKQEIMADLQSVDSAGNTDIYSIR